ncbi:hypothetical protein [Fodinibius roseus]|nr:hypothetical protein [Fodinibius roseus]
MSNNKIDLSFPTGKALWTLLVSQDRQEAKLTHIQEMLEEVYAEGKNEDIEEVRKRLDQTNEKLHQKKLRTILKEVGISNKTIEIALENIFD